MDILIDVNAWIRAAVGGSLIGLAAALLVLVNGRIAGISGIFGGAFLSRTAGDVSWRFLFLGGLVIGALLISATRPELAPITLQTGLPGMMLAGLIVGIGTRMGNGCTSGHGVCGIGRLSGRSVAATGIFMASAFITVFVLRHVLGGSA